MVFSDYYEAIIRNSIKILIVCYFLSLSYESQQKDSTPFPELFIKAPFQSGSRIYKLMQKGAKELYDKYGTTGRILIQFLISFVEALKSTAKSIKNLFWNLIEFIGTIFKFPIDLIKNFSDYAEKLFTFLARQIIKLYHLLLVILSPVYNLVKALFRNIFSIFKLPIESLKQLCLSLFKALKSVARGITKASKTLFRSFIDIIKKLAHCAVYIFKSLLKPFRWIWVQLKLLYLKFSLIPFIKALIDILIHLPRNLWNALCGLCVFLYDIICNGARFIVKTIIGMCLDVLDFLHITKYLRPIIDLIYDALCKLGRFLLDLLIKISVIPYHFAVWLVNLFKHPIQTIVDLFKSLINVIKQIASAFVQILKSGIVQFLVNILKKPLDLIVKLLSKIRFKAILRIITWPLKNLKYIGRLFSAIGRAITNSIIKIANAIQKGFIYLLNLLSQISLRKILGYLIAPIKSIIMFLEYILSRRFVELIKNILYLPVWLVSFLFRSIYFIIGSFVNLFSKNLSFKNIIDMWDNACWPRDAEYCKKNLGKSQNNQDYNNNFEYNFDDYQYV